MGCNSQQEVDSACVYFSIQEIQDLVKCVANPNPFSTTTTIEYELICPETVTITFYNQFGKQVDEIEESQQKGLNKVAWIPGNLPDGIYYFSIATSRIEAGEQVANGKVVLVK